MREIMFRGYNKDFDGDHFVYGETILFQEYRQQWVMLIENELGEQWVDIKEPQQYVGINDKNDSEIYEGDIVIAYDEMIDTICKGQIAWDECECGFCIKGSEPTFIGYYPELEVIGNIYENQELVS